MSSAAFFLFFAFFLYCKKKNETPACKMITTVLLCLVFVTVSFACVPTYVCVWTLCCVVLTWLCLLLLPHFLADAFFVLHSTSDAFFMPVLYPVLSAITKINNKPASFLLFGLEDNYDPELLLNFIWNQKKKRRKIVCWFWKDNNQGNSPHILTKDQLQD